MITQSDKKDEVFSDFPDTDTGDKPVEKSGAEDTIKTFEEQVNTATEAMTQGDDGNWVVPKDLPEGVAYAANLEKRRRDTESALAKTKNSNKALETERDGFKAKLLEGASLNLTVEQKEELEELKGADAEKWLAKKTEYENAALANLEEELGELSEDGEAASEVERRAGVLQVFLDGNPGLVLDDEVFQNDLPQRITSKLAKGGSFEEYLKEAKAFLVPKTKIKDADDKDDDEPDLGKASGGDTVNANDVAKDAVESYKNEIY